MFIGTLAGCQSTSIGYDRTAVTSRIESRTGQAAPLETACGSDCQPADSALLESMSEDGAVALALRGNAAFHEALTDLGIARADLIQAGLLPNPELVYFFHVDEKPLKYVLELPIEALWLRPIRVQAANREAARTRDRLVQLGMDLIRDVRQAYADTLLARERRRVAEKAVELRARIAELAEKRLLAGDASPQEAATARIDALQAKQDAIRIGYELPIAEERLRSLLGIGDFRGPLRLEATIPILQEELDVEKLAAEALADRPDVQAANEAVTAAEERLRLASLSWLRILGIADASSGRRTGHELGPALRFIVPIFNWNQGGIARAEADLERARRQQRTIHNQVILDVRRTHSQYQQARAELKMLIDKVRPEVEAAIRRSQKAYEEGDATYLIVLESTRQLLDSYLREAQLHADLRRAWAELERSAGHHLGRSSSAVDLSKIAVSEAKDARIAP